MTIYTISFFLPVNIISRIQFMDQGVIFAFNALYTWNSSQHFVDAMDPDENFKLKEFRCTIATWQLVIHAILKDMKKSNPHRMLEEDEVRVSRKLQWLPT